MESGTQGPQPMHAEARREHEWLQQLIGEWAFEVGAPAEPGKPAEVLTGKEWVRSLGDIWVIAEGQGETPDGGASRTLMTLGYDPEKAQFVGTWIGSMMHHLWVYEGQLDADERVLTLDATGPDFERPGQTRRYQDVIEVEDADHRLLTGRMLGDDGEWQELMRARYRRV
jgi:hypothetical protein